MRKALLAVLVLLAIGVPFLWFVGLPLFSADQQVTVDKAWASSSLGAIQLLPKAFPKTETNGSARELERLGAELGIDLAPRAETAAAHPTKERAKAFDAVRQELETYLTAQLERPDPMIAPLPAKVRAFADANEAGIAAFATALVERPSPVWSCDVSRLFDAPLPNLLGHLKAQRLLVSLSLAKSLDGKLAGADRLLHASDRLNESLRIRPDLISQIISNAADRMLVGALRKVPVDASFWLPPLALRPRERMLTALKAEAWLARALGERQYPETSLGERVRGAIRRPWDRMAAVAFQDGYRAAIEVAAKSPVSDGSAALLEQAFTQGVRSHGPFTDPALANVFTSWKRADRLALDIELTRKVLEARIARGGAASWPADLPGVETTALAGAKWVYAVSPDGAMSLALDRELRWPDQKGPVLPTRFTAPR